MPNEGTTFNEILEAEELDAVDPATPADADKGASAATDGGTTPAETLGLLKEPEAQEAEVQIPDLKLPAPLQKALDANPDVKTAVEAFIATKEKGIDKFITTKNEEIRVLKETAAQNQPLFDFYQQFEDAETVDHAFAQTCIALAKTYGRPFGGYDATGQQVEASTTTQPAAGEGGSKYGLEFESDDKVVDIVLNRLNAVLDERLGPIAQKFKAEETTAATKAKITQAVPLLKAEFEITADPWITEAMVADAVKTYPDLEPRAAFAAKYTRELATYAVKHSGGSKAKVRELPNGASGALTRGDLKPGASFAEILAAEATL